jgi:hypothetical protein
MENKKQSSVEWLFLMLNNPNDNQEMALKCLLQAKKMHKEEIMDACLSNKTTQPVIKKLFEMQAEQYYNDTYKGGQDE